MKLLVVLPQPPLPEGAAADRCAVGLLRGLVAQGVDVQALAARTSSIPANGLPADLPVEILDASEADDARSRLDRLVRPVGSLSRGGFGARVRELAAHADAIHLETSHTAWCDAGLATPSAVHLHYLVRRDRSLGAPWRREFLQTAEFALAERAAIRRHPELVASSPVVAAELRRANPRARVTLAPLSLDGSLYPPARLDGPPAAGIIGTAAWHPTAQATRRLVHRVWPLVRRRLPDARLRVAGRGMRELPDLVGAPGVELVGEVPSSSEFLRSLSLLLYPIERGSGMKVKVLEALATGLPIVTTANGAEGIEGEGVVVESDDGPLADAALELLQDKGLRVERGAAARATFDSRYAPASATQPLVELYRRIAVR